MMVNRFVRTASTRRLLATIGGIVAVIVAGTAIALAATSGGPVPKHEPLAVAIHQALGAKPVKGISADISFTNRLIDSSEILGSDPLLSGGSGHIWVSDDGRVRLELYGDNGDPELVVNRGSWWIYDPTLKTAYEGKIPGGAADAHKSRRREALPSVTQIQTQLGRLAMHLNISGAIPTDVGGQPTYTVKVSSRRGSGMLGALQLSWDALRGVPLRFAVYARGDSTPVLELMATGVSYEAIPSSDFQIAPPPGTRIVNVATHAATGTHTKHATHVAGLHAVANHLPFKLVAPRKLDGLARQSVKLLDMGGQHGALIVYGQYLGGIIVIESPAAPNGSRKLNLSTGSGEHARGISLPSVTINGVSGQELDTALGTIVHFTAGSVSYTVLGAVRPVAARAAARGL
jgi:outer membrane lipoprotein-sorting protein